MKPSRPTVQGPSAVRLHMSELSLLAQSLPAVEKELYEWALDTHGSQRRAAAALGVPRSTFSDRVRRLGLKSAR